MMKIEYHIKVREIYANRWTLYSRTADRAIAESLMDEALDLTRYNAAQINEVKTKFVCRKEK